MPNVSVIIPVYNVEQYLEKCLDSVINQTLSDIEIICINDCSTDNSLEILKRYAKNDNRIKVIDFKENKGVSAARNAGIEAATGEYIGFVDSDDWIDLDFYEKLYTKAKETQSIICKGKFKVGSRLSNLNYFIEKNLYYFTFQFYTAIYKREFIINNYLYFPEKIITFEDPIFSLKVILKQPKLALESTATYNYNYFNFASNTHSFSQKAMESFLLAAEKVFNIINEAKITKQDYMLLFNEMLFRSVWGRCKKANISKEDFNCFFEKFLELVSNYLKYPDEIDFNKPVSVLFEEYNKHEKQKVIQQLVSNIKTNKNIMKNNN